jgi:NitT/TauT family transport system substrate-binding protein
MKKYLTIVFLLFFISCNLSNRSTRVITTAALKGPSAMAMIKMIDDKPILKDKIRTEYEIWNEPNQVRAMVIKGDVDFAVLPSTMAALLYNKGQSYILAAIPVWGTLYLFGTDTTIHTWMDLKGKNVSLMGRGMTPDIMFRFLASENGIDPDKDVHLDYSYPGHIELANAIIAGASDLGVISEPLVSMVMEKNPCIKPIMDLNREWEKIFGNTVPFAQTAIIVKRELAEKEPELVNEYLKLLKESIAWVNDNPGTASRIIVRYNIMPDTLLAQKSIPRCNLHYAQAFNEMRGIQEYLKVFYNFNPFITGGKLPDEKFYYKEQAD